MKLSKCIWAIFALALAMAAQATAHETPADVAALEKLGARIVTQVTSVDLSRTEVTDAGLAHLKGMTGLEGLGLRGTQVTDAGVEKLQAALPKCMIFR